MTSALVVVATVVAMAAGRMLESAVGDHAEDHAEGPAHFKLGFLAPWTGETVDFSALTSASALSIAIERVHNDPTLKDKMRFRFDITPPNLITIRTDRTVQFRFYLIVFLFRESVSA